MNKLKQTLEKILKKEKTFIDSESGEVNYVKVKDSADKIDKKLIEILISNKELKTKFFTKIKDVYVFNIQDFKFFLDESKIDNSYTQYANKIGLSDSSGLLENKSEVVLDFPFKDCVLEGGQSNEEGTATYFEHSDKTGKYQEKQSKRNEIFFNQVLAHDEIDRLYDKKALINWKRFTKDSKKGGEAVKEIKRDKNGLIKENLIIKGNNLLALHSLKSEFAGKIKLIYIDPPYNTGGDANIFTYNNNFNHSTWLTFMKNRLGISKDLLKDNGFIAVAIDHFELGYLLVLMDSMFGRENRIGIISIVNNPMGRNQAKYFSTINDYMIVYAKNQSKAIFNNVVLNEDFINTFDKSDSGGKYKLKSFVRIGGGDENLRVNKESFWYPLYVRPDLTDISVEKKKNYIEIFPISPAGQERTWKLKKSSTEKILYELVAEKQKSQIIIYQKYRIENGQKVPTIWSDKKYNANHQGARLLEGIMGNKKFSYPKSLYTVLDTLKLMTSDDDIILDFHAGSGTTGHATLELNREDGGNRQFILVEQLEEHIKICIERNQKVIDKQKFTDSFVYFELAKWNETAKEEINKAKDYSALVKLFDSSYEKYFLNYNVKIKDFKDKIIKEKNFKKLPLSEQKRMFLTMLDLNQMYVQESEMGSKEFKISQEDQKLTKEFYKK